MTRSFVNRLLRLTLLPPDVVETILDGRQSKGLQLEDLTSLPSGLGGAAQGIVAAKRRVGIWDSGADRQERTPIRDGRFAPENVAALEHCA